jgi:hypothetical protein
MVLSGIDKDLIIDAISDSTHGIAESRHNPNNALFQHKS